MASVYKHGRGLLLVTAAILSAACAQLAPPKIEYRAGLALHNKPKFSFQVPERWQPATAADWSRFTVNQRTFQKLTQQGRQNFETAGAKDMATFTAVFIHNTGAFMGVFTTENKGGVKFSKGYTLSDVERDNIWHAFEKAMSASSAAADKPRLTRESLGLVEFDQAPALAMVFTQEDNRGKNLWSSLTFHSETHTVIVMHGTTPDRASDGRDGLDTLGRTFRFE
jgi:hypothetical protein